MEWHFCGGDVQVRHRPTDDLSTHVVTFDCYHDDHTVHRLAFGEQFLCDQRVGATHVLTRTNDWFQYPEIDEILECVRHAVRDADRLMAYGSSMGGYAAIRFADAIGATSVLALSPQYSVDPAIVPWERRWAADQRRIAFQPELNGPIACAVRPVIIFDSSREDQKHVERIAADIAVTAIGIPFAGHPVGPYLSEADLLTETVLATLHDRLDADALRQSCRAKRRTLTNYHAGLSALQPKSRLRTAIGLARRAVALAPDYPGANYQLAIRLSISGDYAGAVEAHERTLGHGREPVYLHSYGETWMRAGDFDRALVLLDEAIDRCPDIAVFHHSRFLTLKALDRQAESADALQRASILDPGNDDYRVKVKDGRSGGLSDTVKRVFKPISEQVFKLSEWIRSRSTDGFTREK